MEKSWKEEGKRGTDDIQNGGIRYNKHPVESSQNGTRAYERGKYGENRIKNSVGSK